LSMSDTLPSLSSPVDAPLRPPATSGGSPGTWRARESARIHGPPRGIHEPQDVWCGQSPEAELGGMLESMLLDGTLVGLFATGDGGPLSTDAFTKALRAIVPSMHASVATEAFHKLDTFREGAITFSQMRQSLASAMLHRSLERQRPSVEPRAAPLASASALHHHPAFDESRTSAATLTLFNNGVEISPMTADGMTGEHHASTAGLLESAPQTPASKGLEKDLVGSDAADTADRHDSLEQNRYAPCLAHGGVEEAYKQCRLQYWSRFYAEATRHGQKL
jgi:hypothetical protein